MSPIFILFPREKSNNESMNQIIKSEWLSSHNDCSMIQITKWQCGYTKLWSSWDKMNTHSTKELHNCKVESEAAGLNNGNS